MLVESPSGKLLEWMSEEWMSQAFDKTPSDPFEVAVTFLREAPDWLVLGGLGDHDDWYHARKRWPFVKLLGIDPDPRVMVWQREHNWPRESTLLRKALSTENGFQQMDLSTVCCASLHPLNVEKAKRERPQDVWDVECVKLDHLESMYGPFYDSILWLDCEGLDYAALVGGGKLLGSGRAMLVNFEVRYETAWEAEQARQFLESKRFHHAKTWFRQWWGHNEIWSRR